MAEQINDGGPAFPRPIGNVLKKENGEGEYNAPQKGMSLRDYFATQAMQGMLSAVRSGEPELYYDAPADKGETPPDNRDFVTSSVSRWASNAYVIADAMLKAREAT